MNGDEQFSKIFKKMENMLGHGLNKTKANNLNQIVIAVNKHLMIMVIHASRHSIVVTYIVVMLLFVIIAAGVLCSDVSSILFQCAFNIVANR